MTKSLTIFSFALLVLSTVIATTTWKFYLEPIALLETKERLKVSAFKKLEKQLIAGGQLQENIVLSEKNYSVEYTFNSNLNDYIKKLLKRYRTDYSSIVVLDNNNGKILSAVDYDGKAKKFSKNIAFSTTHPAASLFKIVTSAALLEGGHITPTTNYTYRGKGSTLYKYQLRNKKSKWRRNIPFNKAFASSNNVVVGKAALEHLTGTEIFDMALSMGFNRTIFSDINMSSSRFPMPDSQYNLAELASGFNKSTLISPVHAALLSSVVANDGLMPEAYIVEKITSDIDGNSLFSRKLSEQKQVISTATSLKLKKMMLAVVKKGTARRFYRKFNRFLRSNLEVGGKTGSITGGIPFGKRDWFTAFALPRDKLLNDKGISVSVMNINVKKWHVRSTFLAKKIIEHYYKSIKPLARHEKKIASSEY